METGKPDAASLKKKLKRLETKAEKADSKGDYEKAMELFREAVGID
jgi:hypothetical protein